MAYITMPSQDTIAVLDFSAGGAPVAGPTISVPRGCTEIISNSGGTRLYVANAGIAPSGGEFWQHSVLEINISTGSISGTPFITERQPRALTLSPDETRLFVGTAFGALGGPPIRGSHVDPANDFIDFFDGGSVVGYTVADRQNFVRIAVGSPVRGLATLGGDEYGATDANEYQIYFTNVGNGAQSEDPEFGGRAIPNVVTAVRFTSLNQPQARQDVVFGHDPDLPDTDPASRATVVPEKLAVRPLSSGSFAAELWVTNSGSGTVARANIMDITGSIDVSSSEALMGTFSVVPEANRIGINRNTVLAVHGTNAIKEFQMAEAPRYVVTSAGSQSATTLFASRPRGLTIDQLTGDVLVVTEFDHQLVRVPASGGNPTFSTLCSDPTADPSDAERNFFTFGRGFEFREGGGGADPVNTISCGTCHVDGHIDGKVRMTVTSAINLPGINNGKQPVAVPSVFDVGTTEWLFFEGLKTIADRGALNPGVTGNVCGYCNGQQFFLNTIEFTE
ncbi:hypothetical protein DRQ53_10845, partial [bacterium]